MKLSVRIYNNHSEAKKIICDKPRPTNVHEDSELVLSRNFLCSGIVSIIDDRTNTRNDLNL